MILRVFLATGLFGLIHSLLASTYAKQRAADWLGPRQRSGLYRVFFILQSALTLAGLLAYLSRLPDRTLYRARGWSARLLRLGQLSGLIFATAAAWQVGLARITGLAPLLAYLRGDAQVQSEPEAQGPAPTTDAPGAPLRDGGPFQISRHPLNLSPLPIFWLTPTLTLKRLAFNLAASLYLVLGSIHEEARLRAAYGEPYRRYERSGVRFYL